MNWQKNYELRLAEQKIGKEIKATISRWISTGNMETTI
jgi:hypothetical protein